MTPAATGCLPRGPGAAALPIVLIVSAVLMAPASIALSHDDPSAQIDGVTARLESGEDDAALLLKRAELHRVREEWSEALADLQAAHRIAPEMDAVDLALGELLLAAGDLAAALPAIDRFLADHPLHSAAHRVRARILLRSGAALDAAAAFTRTIDLARSTPGSAAAQPEDYIDRARALASTGPQRLRAAIAGLDDGITALGAPVTLELLAIRLEEQGGGIEAALRRIASLEARAARKETWIAMRGDLLARAGRHREAGTAYDRALAEIAALPPRLRDARAASTLAAELRDKRAGLNRTTALAEVRVSAVASEERGNP